jgi:hypothetical protein
MITKIENHCKKDNCAYFFLENLKEVQKLILHNPFKTIEIDDENIILFMLESSIQYRGDWCVGVNTLIISCYCQNILKNALHYLYSTPL